MGEKKTAQAVGPFFPDVYPNIPEEFRS